MKIRNSKSRNRNFLVLTALAAGFTGCTSLNNHPAMDSMSGLTGGKNGLAGKNFVEAYIEYRGPHEKWSGPSTFLLHVIAKEGEQAKITFTPSFASETSVVPPLPVEKISPPILSGRKLASEVPSQLLSPLPSPLQGMTGEAARNQINQLAAALQAGDVAFDGCLSPVRVRLIRADGAVVEKQGCRSGEGWPKVASEAMGHFMEKAGS